MYENSEIINIVAIRFQLQTKIKWYQSLFEALHFDNRLSLSFSCDYLLLIQWYCEYLSQYLEVFRLAF